MMCAVSMIMDHYGDKWQKYQPSTPLPQPLFPTTIPLITPAEIQEFRQLLERAREYDKRNNEPECELEEKRERVKKLAKELGVEVEFV